MFKSHIMTMDQQQIKDNRPACNHLDTKASIIPSSDSPGSLCTVCQEIDFELLTAEGCPHCTHVNPDVLHFHIGTVKDISDKEASCAGCRLIMAVVKAYTAHRDWWEKYHVRLSSGVFALQRLDVVTQEETNAADQANAIGAPLSHNQLSQRPFIDVQIQTSSGRSVPMGAIVRMVGDDFGLSRSGTKLKLCGSTEEPFQGGRLVAPQVDADIVKHWLSLCATTHPMCGGGGDNSIVDDPFSTTSESTIRLIDVHEQNIVSANLSYKFLALSYVWGNTPGLLTEARLPSFSIPGGLTSAGVKIPQTISDAISFTRSIGERYLWIDSLCIIQDSETDKNHQLPLMGSIYSCAFLVLIVATERDHVGANSGIPRVGPVEVAKNQHHHPRQALQRVETINSTPFITLLPDLHSQVQRTTWNRRGWTFQEAILARRSLVFTSNQVYFCCRTANWREDVASESCETVIVESDMGGTFRIESLFSPARLLFGGPTGIVTCRNRMYTGQAEHFSTRVFTNEADVFWAFAGVLRRLQTTSMGRSTTVGAGLGLFPGGFIWAMPYESLDVVLLWDPVRMITPCEIDRGPLIERVRRRVSPHVVEVDVRTTGPCTDTHTERGNGAGAYSLSRKKRFALKYPSWSWLSVTSAFNFWDGCGDGIISHVTWHEPILLGSEQSLPYMSSVLVDTSEAGPDSHFNGREKEEGEMVGVREYKGLREASAAWKGAMDYGLLHFIAQTAILTVTRVTTEDEAEVEENGAKEGPVPASEDGVDVWVEAIIKSSDGREVKAKITVPSAFFGSQSGRTGEFVLLSSIADEEVSDEECTRLMSERKWTNVRDVAGCKHIKSHNLMLIEWKGDIAYRQGIYSVGVKEWGDMVTVERRIVLA